MAGTASSWSSPAAVLGHALDFDDHDHREPTHCGLSTSCRIPVTPTGLLTGSEVKEAAEFRGLLIHSTSQNDQMGVTYAVLRNFRPVLSDCDCRHLTFCRLIKGKVFKEKYVSLQRTGKASPLPTHTPIKRSDYGSKNWRSHLQCMRGNIYAG